MSEDPETENSMPPPKMRLVKVPTKLPTFYEMVIEALTKLDDRKGVSVQAIRNYIAETYKSVDPNTMKYRMKLALAKGLDNGLFKRPKSSEDSKGATGRFKIDKTAMVSKKKKIKKDKIEKSVKAKKAKPESAKSKESKGKGSLKSIKKTPAKAKARSPKSTATPKKAAPSKKIVNDEEKGKKGTTKSKEKAITKKDATKKSTPKKSSTKKSTPKKTATKKTTPKKSAEKKVPAKKDKTAATKKA